MLRKVLFVVGVLLLAGGLLGGGLNGISARAAKSEQSAEPQNCIAILQPGQTDRVPVCEEATGSLPTPTPPFAINLGPGQHCVIEIDPLRPGESVSQMHPIGCFATFSEAIAAATGDEIQLPADVDPTEITPEMLAPAQSNIVVGIDYINPNFGGQSVTWETAHTPGCSDGSTYGTPNMPSSWNDVVSSAHSYAGCNHYYHYEHTYWTGSVRDCGGSCATMGVMDNATSSERWTP